MTTSTASENKVVHFSDFLAEAAGGLPTVPPAAGAPAGEDKTRSFSEFVASLPADAAAPAAPESAAPAAAPAAGPEPQPSTRLEDAVKKFGQSADDSSKALMEALAEQQKKTDARWERAQATLEKFATEMAASSKALNKSLQEVAAALRPSPDSTAS